MCNGFFSFVSLILKARKARRSKGKGTSTTSEIKEHKTKFSYKSLMRAKKALISNVMCTTYMYCFWFSILFSVIVVDFFFLDFV